MWGWVLSHVFRRPAAALGALCALLVLGGLPGRAEAAFGDCADPAYRAGFDERLRHIDYLCVERLNLDVPSATSATGEGAPRIRVVHDVAADWAADESLMPEYDRGVRAAIDMLGRMGPYRLPDVTILLADDLPPREDAERFSGIAAFTSPIQPRPECQIVFFLLGPGATGERAAAVVAHEIFHCVQKANFSPGQMRSVTDDGHGGAWWIEGSAAWFAAAAVPDAEAYRQRSVDLFDAESAETPLFRMRYGAATFFFWLAGRRGEAQILSFLSGMADRPDDRAQAAAMQDALPPAEWLSFAEDYLDDRIPGPAGAALGSRPHDGPTWTWTASRTERIRLDPFVLARGWIDCDCGEWETATRPDVAHAARPERGETWAELPARLEVAAGARERFRFAGVNAAPAAATLEVEARQDVGCAECAGLRTVDACLVGTWRQTGGGPEEWLRRTMPAHIRITSAERRNDVFTLNGDGTYVTAVFGSSATAVAETGSGEIQADADLQAQANGYWSAADGRLNLCPSEEALEGQVRLTSSDGDRSSMRLGPGRPTQTAQSYACDGDTLQTSMEIPGSGTPMETTYARVPGG